MCALMKALDLQPDAFICFLVSGTRHDEAQSPGF